MSFTENDRKVQSKIGKTFPKRAGYDGPPIAEVIAAALKADFGTAPSAMKHIARLTGANERAVRNWMGGQNRPSAEMLICLMRPLRRRVYRYDRTGQTRSSIEGQQPR